MNVEDEYLKEVVPDKQRSTRKKTLGQFLEKAYKIHGYKLIVIPYWEVSSFKKNNINKILEVELK